MLGWAALEPAVAAPGAPRQVRWHSPDVRAGLGLKTLQSPCRLSFKKAPRRRPGRGQVTSRFCATIEHERPVHKLQRRNVARQNTVVRSRGQTGRATASVCSRGQHGLPALDGQVASLKKKSSPAATLLKSRRRPCRAAGKAPSSEKPPTIAANRRRPVTRGVPYGGQSRRDSS